MENAKQEDGGTRDHHQRPFWGRLETTAFVLLVVGVLTVVIVSCFYLHKYVPPALPIERIYSHKGIEYRDYLAPWKSFVYEDAKMDGHLTRLSRIDRDSQGIGEITQDLVLTEYYPQLGSPACNIWRDSTLGYKLQEEYDVVRKTYLLFHPEAARFPENTFAFPPPPPDVNNFEIDRINRLIGKMLCWEGLTYENLKHGGRPFEAAHWKADLVFNAVKCQYHKLNWAEQAILLGSSDTESDLFVTNARQLAHIPSASHNPREDFERFLAQPYLGFLSGRSIDHHRDISLDLEQIKRSYGEQLVADHLLAAPIPPESNPWACTDPQEPPHPSSLMY